MDGVWAYYPGSGYQWVSAYPWGWTPYRCGSWLFNQSFGWGWLPGGCMNGFGFVPVVGAPVGFHRPLPPTGTPGRGTIVMGPRPILHSTVPMNRMVIQSNSAGLGIPRGSIRDMPHLSSQVRQNGSVTTTVRPTPIVAPLRTYRNPGMSRPSSSGSSSPRVSSPARTAPAPTMSAPRPSGGGGSVAPRGRPPR